MIKRKPVPTGHQEKDAQQAAEFTQKPVATLVIDENVESLQCAADVDVSGRTPNDADFDAQLDNLELEVHTVAEQPIALIGQGDEPVHRPSRDSESRYDDSSKPPDLLKTAWGEVTHFVGGLVEHPYEATKHFSILRHSHGLVIYKGPTTSVSITVFSDEPLPPDRRFWLQKRGFSGKIGQAVGTLGSRSTWVDVTPAIDGQAELLPPADERAWQRDIRKFLRSAQSSKTLRHHQVRETDVIRIPYVAEDGYFRIVLCDGRKVLCPSPAFRYASTNTDPGRVRGASLKTLPLELAVKVGTHMARTATGNVVQNAYQSTVGSTVQQYAPSGLTQTAAVAVYDASGAAEKVHKAVDVVDERYSERRELTYESAAAAGANTTSVMELKTFEEPKAPFPITLSGMVGKISDLQDQTSGITVADVLGVDQDAVLRLTAGFYIGWANFLPTKRSAAVAPTDTIGLTPYEVLVTVLPARDKQLKVIEQKHVSLCLLSEPKGMDITQTKLKVTLLALLRPADEEFHTATASSQQYHTRMMDDIATTQLILRQPGWSLEDIEQRKSPERSQRSFLQRLGDARQAGQKQFDKIPLHLLGVKTGSAGLKDQLIGNGGICIKR